MWLQFSDRRFQFGKPGFLLAVLVVFLSAQALASPDKSSGETRHKKAHGQREAGAASVSAPSRVITPTRSPYGRRGAPESARDAYVISAGVDLLKVQRTASGNLIRFSYTVIDPDKAKVLIDRQSEPFLIDPVDRVALKVPVMDNVGPLRQTTALEAGKAYWVVFANKGDYVKVGDLVDVVIGNFHVNGLRVE